jgi:DNA-binding MarR family transcriptional regulator
MEFHVWDFPRKLEVRLNGEMINRIRNMRTQRRVLVKQTQLQLSPGWKEPLVRKPYYVTKSIKLIANSDGHPFEKIGERLYSKLEWHGDGRNSIPHKPYINISELETVQRVTGISREELERSVVSVRNRNSSLEVGMKFPLAADGNWAWLFGYYFACGGLVTRDRVDKAGYPSEERAIRFVVERRVFETKVMSFLKQIGCSAELKSIWYEKHGAHRLDKQRRVGLGNRPRKVFFLPTAIREVMEHFGLYTDIPHHHTPRGRELPSSRRFKLRFPAWIEQYPQQFMEGFMNGSVTSTFRPDKEGNLYRSVELRVGFLDLADTMTLIDLFKQYSEKLGITGNVRRLKHRESETVYWLSFSIFNHRSLDLLFENFDVQQPAYRARLSVHYFMNSLLYELCRKLHSTEILVVGALLEKPRTKAELIDMFRFREDQVTGALGKLEKAGFAVREKDGQWRIIPTGAKHRILTALKEEDQRRRNLVSAMNELFFSRCQNCGNIIRHNYSGRCGCGGVYHPVERCDVLRSYRTRNGPKIARIMDQVIPVRGG